MDRNDERSKIRLACKESADRRNWPELLYCTERLLAYDPDAAEALREMAIREAKTEPRTRALQVALRDGDFPAAKTELDQIPEISVYRRTAIEDFDTAADAVVGTLVPKAQAAKGEDDRCAAWGQLIAQIKNGQSGQTVADMVKRKAPCTPKLAIVAADSTPPMCNADDLKAKAQEAFSASNAVGALRLFEESYACRASANVAQLAFIAACNAKKRPAATKWYKLLAPTAQAQVLSVCIRIGITQDMLQP